MRCDECGREIRSDEKSLSTTFDLEGAPIGTRAYLARGSRTIPLVLCEICAARRQATQRWFLGALVILIGGLIVASLLVGLLTR
jgi:hypothetical protein